MSHTAPARPPGIRRGVSWFAVALLAAAGGGALAAPAHAGGSAVPASQPLVVLLADHAVRTRPSTRARRGETVAGRRPLTHVRTVLPEVDRVTSPGGPTWVQVRLPGRPNGHLGWIDAARTRRTATGWHVSVKLSTRRVTVYRDGHLERRFSAVVGTRSTPTPVGRFFVEEGLALSSREPGGPFALATSARSQVLQEFNGGPGQIALHGTNHLGDPLGTAASHGCIRLSPRAITWLARRVGRGVPLTIAR